ncbi:hypothetical protein ACFWOT_32295 [Streptomyces sp. NPDC058440]|uniref:hypothetical protein n=1 Tax=Streptomyces sp. NPDC058440 TaxID=3346501 RepID=UPI003646ADF6
MPANYYDDLAARYELADDELEIYRDLGILYDRDAGGAFRHCYTETASRVFFELVQRDPGYGAADAPCGWRPSTPSARHADGRSGQSTVRGR